MEAVPVERWAAVDWGSESHQVVVIDAEGKRLDAFRVAHTPGGLEELLGCLRRQAPISAVAVETVQGLLVEKLLEGGLAVYPINPKLSHAWRQGRSVAGSKSDVLDAELLAEGLRQNHKKLKLFRPDDPLTRQLALLCRDECQLIAERTALVLRLEATLKLYYAAALEWFSDWTSPAAWDFVLAFPRPEDLLKASRRKLIGFLKTHHIGLSPIWLQRFERRGEAAHWPSDPATIQAKSLLAIGLAKQLHTLRAVLDQYREQIEQLYGNHPDASLFSSLPGTGPKLGPRMLCCFGADRSRYDSAKPLMALGGCVPVTRQSGKHRTVSFRHACRKDARNTLTLFAMETLNKSPWARLFYDQARARGQSHFHALRNLACKWIKIIYRLWQEHKPYDERLYLASLIRHRSPLVAQLKPLITGG